MRGFIQVLIFLYCLLHHSFSFSQEAEDPALANTVPDPSANKVGSSSTSKLSSQIFEKESDEKSFSAKVKLVRDSDEVEVFFEGKEKGPYLLKEGPNLGLYKERLIKSQKSNSQSVAVKVNNDIITNVELTVVKENPKSSKIREAEVLDSIFKK